MPPCKFFALVYRTIFRSLQYQKRSPLSMSFCSFIGEHKRNLDGHCLKLGTFCEDWPTQIQMAKTLGEHCCCTTLFRNERFILNLIPQRNASKFAILLSYENHGEAISGQSENGEAKMVGFRNPKVWQILKRFSGVLS